jgi:hypothetical protein
MPEHVTTGQSWSAWVPARQQWLQATVIQDAAGQATLKFDARYGMGRGADEQKADHATMLSNRNLYRFIADQAAA